MPGFISSSSTGKDAVKEGVKEAAPAFTCFLWARDGWRRVRAWKGGRSWRSCRLCPPRPWRPSPLTHAAQQQRRGAVHAQERQRRERCVVGSPWKESQWVHQSVGRGAVLSDGAFWASGVYRVALCWQSGIASAITCNEFHRFPDAFFSSISPNHSSTWRAMGYFRVLFTDTSWNLLYK